MKQLFSSILLLIIMVTLFNAGAFIVSRTRVMTKENLEVHFHKKQIELLKSIVGIMLLARNRILLMPIIE